MNERQNAQQFFYQRSSIVSSLFKIALQFAQLRLQQLAFHIVLNEIELAAAFKVREQRWNLRMRA